MKSANFLSRSLDLDCEGLGCANVPEISRREMIAIPGPDQLYYAISYEYRINYTGNSGLERYDLRPHRIRIVQDKLEDSSGKSGNI